MTNNKEYKPEYPIIDTSDLVPREEIVLVPDSKLSPIERAELTNLRRGIEYNLCLADTPQNREAIVTKTAYFQMVAYKEGWDFDTQKYQVRFVHPQYFLLSEAGTQKRVYEFQGNTDISGLSAEKRAGFLIIEDRAIRMKSEETDGLAKRLLKHVFG